MKSGRSKMLRAALIVLSICAASAALAQGAASGADYRPDTPFAYLFDTGSSSPRPLSAGVVAAKTGWTVLPEDELKHKFQGDAVMLNDRLAVVFRRKGTGAEVYAFAAAGPVRRAVLMSLPGTGRSVRALAGVKIIENNVGAVMLEAAYTTAAGSRCSARYRLTTGARTVEMRAGEAAERLFVWSQVQYVVVPNFFGDDMVFGPQAFGVPRHGLPSEDFLLNLIRGGDAMTMCVWRSRKQQSYAILTGEQRQRVIRGCEIEGGKDQNLWVAFLEAGDIWYEYLRTHPAPKETLLDWKPPFPAKWRADFRTVSGEARSQDFATGTGAVSEAWIQGDGTLAGPRSRDLLGSLVAYPIDRTKATPLTAFCPTDVLRNTLGVGPCQYVLQTEGLDSETHPTPALVMDWVEKQFKSSKEEEAAQQIRSRLKQMIKHVERVQARIGRYADFAEEVQVLCRARSGEASGQPLTGAELGSRAVRLEDISRFGPHAEKPAERAAKLADELVGLIGREDALAECGRLGNLLRELDIDLSRRLSNCRMTVRWMKQRARAIAVEKPHLAALAKEVETRAERILQNE